MSHYMNGIVMGVEAALNHALAERLSGEGASVLALRSKDCTESDVITKRIHDAGAALDGLNFVIIGEPEGDESALWRESPAALTAAVERQLEEDFVVLRASLQACQRGARILFPMFAHQLAYDGMPSRPVLSAARTSLVRSLAREAAAIGVSVHIVTYYYGADVNEARALRKSLRLYGPRVVVPTQDEIVTALASLAATPQLLATGETIALTAGLPRP